MSALRDELSTLRQIKIAPRLHKLLEGFFKFFAISPDCLVAHANERRATLAAGAGASAHQRGGGRALAIGAGERSAASGVIFP